jgi:FixJ family two-component response regulator
VVDLTMPGMGGRGVLRALRDRGDRVPIVITSGYSAEGLDIDLRVEEKVAFAQKPFDFVTLQSAVRSVVK